MTAKGLQDHACGVDEIRSHEMSIGKGPTVRSTDDSGQPTYPAADLDDLKRSRDEFKPSFSQQRASSPTSMISTSVEEEGRLVTSSSLYAHFANLGPWDLRTGGNLSSAELRGPGPAFYLA